MKLPLTGGCLCGKIRYEISETPQLVYTCHCVDCQRLTSSAFSIGMVVNDPTFRLIGIEPRKIQRTADSGPYCDPMGSPGVWLLGLRLVEFGSRPASRAGRDIGRYILAASDRAFLDPQQAALDNAA